jgi:aspartate/glutamate racemase
MLSTVNKTKKILILSANSTDTNKLRLDEEAREIQAGLDRARLNLHSDCAEFFIFCANPARIFHLMGNLYP